jgi:hypothetical protein
MTRPDTGAAEQPTTLGYLVHGLPAWKVTGHRGEVSFMSAGSLLLFNPTWSHTAVIVDRRASELAAPATAADDEQVLKLLTEHYHQLPAGPPDWPTAAEQWWQLDTGDLVAAFARCRWYPHRVDRATHGWCVMPVDQPPSAGIPAVGWFMYEDTARSTARDHNSYLPETPIGDQL